MNECHQCSNDHTLKIFRNPSMSQKNLLHTFFNMSPLFHFVMSKSRFFKNSSKKKFNFRKKDPHKSLKTFLKVRFLRKHAFVERPIKNWNTNNLTENALDHMCIGDSGETMCVGTVCFCSTAQAKSLEYNEIMSSHPISLVTDIVHTEVNLNGSIL